MKNIICYGDSNTFGYNPADGSRFDKDTRWTGILQNILKDDYNVIEEGLCNRTGFADNPNGLEYSAQKHFPHMLSKYSYIDILLLAVGTNDLQFLFQVDSLAVQNGLENLINIAKKTAKNVIIVPPVILTDDILNGYFKIQFDRQSILKSKTAGKLFKECAEKLGCSLFDIKEFAMPSVDDGLHYDAAAHKLIAVKIAEFIKNKF